MFKVVYSLQFYVDIWLIKDYISFTLRDSKSAQSIIDEIMNKSESLCDFPDRYPIRFVGNTKYRRMLVKKFNVYYCVDKKTHTVTIARVLYGGLDINQVTIIN